MNRGDFQRLSRLRLIEASALLRLGHYPGAYYLAGYAVECALKACIAKQTRRYDFPDRAQAAESYTHDLSKLVRVAGLEVELANALRSDPAFALNWSLVTDWSEAVRYEVGLTEHDAKNLLAACVVRRYGILPWIRHRW